MEGYSIALLPAKIENGSANENEATLYPYFVCLFVFHIFCLQSWKLLAVLYFCRYVNIVCLSII